MNRRDFESEKIMGLAYTGTAPCSIVKATMSLVSISLEGAPRITPSAAAAPMAWPMAMQVHWARMPARATRSAEMMRPATVMRELPLGMSARKGTLGSRSLEARNWISHPV